MAILVADCNSWIGYHVVNELLENDYKVHGINSERGNDTLSMFFGRHSLFTFVNAGERKVYDAAIIIGDGTEIGEIETSRFVILSNSNRKLPEYKNKIIIKTPLLFGEWMPMNEKGFNRNNELIAFDSDLFHAEAVYIKDFTKGLIQWLQTPSLPRVLEVKSAKEKEKKNLKLENSVYIRDNVPISEKLKLVQDHYHQYKDSY